MKKYLAIDAGIWGNIEEIAFCIYYSQLTDYVLMITFYLISICGLDHVLSKGPTTVVP